MIEMHEGDLLASDAEALVNAVNTVGVMGKGIALRFKRAYPDNFESYAAACRQHEVVPGRMFVVDDREGPSGRCIVNFPTKEHWRAKSRLAYIEDGLADLARVIESLRLRSLAVPALGCGAGGLDWADVEPRIRDVLGALPNVRIALFAPGPT